MKSAGVTENKAAEPAAEVETGNVNKQSIDNSDIIKSGSDDVILENQRYGRNKETIVNKTYIESGEYRRKFDNATDNPEVL